MEKESMRLRSECLPSVLCFPSPHGTSKTIAVFSALPSRTRHKRECWRRTVHTSQGEEGDGSGGGGGGLRHTTRSSLTPPSTPHHRRRPASWSQTRLMIPPATHSLRQLTPSPYWVVAEVMTEEAPPSEGNSKPEEGNVL